MPLILVLSFKKLFDVQEVLDPEQGQREILHPHQGQQEIQLTQAGRKNAALHDVSRLCLPLFGLENFQSLQFFICLTIMTS